MLILILISRICIDAHPLIVTDNTTQFCGIILCNGFVNLLRKIYSRITYVLQRNMFLFYTDKLLFSKHIVVCLSTSVLFDGYGKFIDNLCFC